MDIEDIFRNMIEIAQKSKKHHRDMIFHIMGLIRDRLGSKVFLELSIDEAKVHITHHLDNFGDLEHAKTMGGNEKYLVKRKVLIQGYKELLDGMILNLENASLIDKNIFTDRSLSNIGFIEDVQSRYPYYGQLQCIIGTIFKGNEDIKSDCIYALYPEEFEKIKREVVK